MKKLVMLTILTAAMAVSANEPDPVNTKDKWLRDRVLSLMTYYCKHKSLELAGAVDTHKHTFLNTSPDVKKGLKGIDEYNQILYEADVTLEEVIDSFLQRCYWVLK